jgi:hypothetical protein
MPDSETQIPIALFYHVEKCGGTSLISSSRMRPGFLHCDLVIKDRQANAASSDDLARALKYYPKADFISGHCLNPMRAKDYSDVIASCRGRRAVHIALLREPQARLLSDYTHDLERRGSNASLDDYLETGWKQNYLCRFFGEGDLDPAASVLRSFDLVADVASEGAVIARLAEDHEIELLPPAHVNSARAGLSPELSVEGGVSIGRYRVSEAHARRLRDVTALDQALLAKIDLLPPEAQGRTEKPKLAEDATRSGRARWYRNLVYKPLGCRRFGETALPRNAKPAGDVAFSDPGSIWSPVS